MVSTKKVTGKAASFPVGLAVGLAVSMGITLMSAALLTHLVLSEKMSENAIGYGAMVILLIAAAVGAWIAAVLVKHRWMVVCLGAGGSYFLTLLAITALFFGGQYQGVGVTALLILGGSGGVGLLGLRQGKKVSFKRKKYRSR